MRKTVLSFVSAISLSALLAAPDATAAPRAQQVSTPAPGTPERKQILDAIRPSSGSQIRFIVHDLRVMKGKSANFAYAAVEPARQEYDGGEYILRNDGPKTKGGWRVIWAVTGGGSNTCADIAEYYRAVARLLAAEGIAPDRLNPGHSEEQKNLSAAAQADADCNTVGDLGPTLD
jgi:hypothetical protein